MSNLVIVYKVSNSLYKYLPLATYTSRDWRVKKGFGRVMQICPNRLKKKISGHYEIGPKTALPIHRHGANSVTKVLVEDLLKWCKTSSWRRQCLSYL